MIRFGIEVISKKTPKQLEEEKSEQLNLCLFRPPTDEVYKNASLRERYVFDNLTRIFMKEYNIRTWTKKAYLQFDGAGAGNAKMFDKSPYDPKHPLDIAFIISGKLIALIEVSGSDKYIDLTYPFDTIPIRRYKVDGVDKLENKVPAFYVFIFWKKIRTMHARTVHEATEYWTTIAIAKKSGPPEALHTRMTLKGETQWNYMVSKDEWTIGLNSLAKELIRLVPEAAKAEKKP